MVLYFCSGPMITWWKFGHLAILPLQLTTDRLQLPHLPISPLHPSQLGPRGFMPPQSFLCTSACLVPLTFSKYYLSERVPNQCDMQPSCRGHLAPFWTWLQFLQSLRRAWFFQNVRFGGKLSEGLREQCQLPEWWKAAIVGRSQIISAGHSFREGSFRNRHSERASSSCGMWSFLKRLTCIIPEGSTILHTGTLCPISLKGALENTSDTFPSGYGNKVALVIF